VQTLTLRYPRRGAAAPALVCHLDCLNNRTVTIHVSQLIMLPRTCTTASGSFLLQLYKGVMLEEHGHLRQRQRFEHMCESGGLQEIKAGDQARTRALMERTITLQLPAKKMKVSDTHSACCRPPCRRCPPLLRFCCVMW
jgi:hypothetical protein